MLEEYFWTAYHPIGPESERPITGTNEVYLPGVFGDVFDVIFAHPDTRHWRTIDTYPVVIVAGEIDLTAAEGQRLAQYVNSGGTLLVADAHLTGPGLTALNLPPTSPWWLTLLGAVIAIVIGKQVYGGLGSNPFNPALVARVVLLISFPVQMTTWSAPAPLGSGLDLVTTATPLGTWKNAVMLTGQAPVEMQGGMTQYFLGNMPGCIGEVSALALLLGAAYLLYRRILTWHIPAAFVGSVVLFSGLFWLINPAKYPSPIFHLLTGGLVLRAETFAVAVAYALAPFVSPGFYDME